MATKARQYTVRNVSPQLDRALKAKAVARGVSLNVLMVEALEAAAGITAVPRTYDDLDDLFGTWVKDAAVARALSDQRRVDPKDWE